MPKRILVADTSDSDRRLSAILAGQDVMFARTIGEAQRLLAQQQFDLVMIGVHFDDSRMFDLVRAIRADDFQNEVPIVCVRGTPGYTVVSTSTLESALKVLAADTFVDLLHFAQEHSGNAALRAAVQRYLKE